MTEQYFPPLPDPEGIARPAVPGSTGAVPDQGGSAGTQSFASDSQSTVDVAKNQAGDLADTAKRGGQQVAQTAKEQAGNVAGEAKDQLRGLLDQAQSELGSQAASQQQRLADGVQSLGGELRSMAEKNEQPGLATQLARQGADVADQVSSWLNEREPGRLLDDVRSFARQRPGTFLLLAAGAGVLAGRLTRGVKDAPPSPTASGGASTGRPAGFTPSSSVDVPTSSSFGAPSSSFGAPAPSSALGEPVRPLPVVVDEPPTGPGPVLGSERL
jgi:uncharacterized protein YjbJ (UPF0337 family)